MVVCAGRTHVACDVLEIRARQVPGILPIQAEEWYTCYLIEESLSMDNLFAFYMVFLYFKVPFIRWLFAWSNNTDLPRS